MKKAEVEKRLEFLQKQFKHLEPYALWDSYRCLFTVVFTVEAKELEDDDWLDLVEQKVKRAHGIVVDQLEKDLAYLKTYRKEAAATDRDELVR